MAPSSSAERSPLLPQKPSEQKLPFPLGYASEGIRPYLELIRLHRITGSVLVFMPYAWGLTMAAYTVKLPLQQYWTELAKFLIMAINVRGSACTINDILDRDFDAGVERTKSRPLPSGRVSVFAAVVYLLAQYILGIVLPLSYNRIAFWAALIQLLPLFLLYPLMKRITYWPQAYLGICMNFGIVVSWTAITNSINWDLLPVLLVGTWGWTVHYDTIYAVQDREDDVKVGVKSMAVMLGDYVLYVTFACACLFVAGLAYGGVINHQTPIFFIISVGGTALHLLWQYATVDLNDSATCGRCFSRNGYLGVIPWAGLMFDYLIKIDKLPFGCTI